MPSVTDVLQFLADRAPALLDEIIGKYPDADYSEIKRPAGGSMEDAAAAAHRSE